MIMRLSSRGMPSKMLRIGEEGSALVELAISLPLLSLMLLGAAEFARLAYASIEVVNGAHAAAMYASSSLAASGDTGGITNAALADAGNLQGGNAISVTSVTKACTCSSGPNPANCSDNATCQSNGAAMITTVTVQTQATFSTLIHIPGGTPTFTLHGQSAQVVSNQ
jgi:Flp pilus assembly protein TadG